MSRSCALLAVFILVGCSNPEHPAPPPPPTGLADLTLTTDTGTLRTGHALAMKPFVATVRDSSGATVSLDAVTLTALAPVGWTVHGDTVTAPGTEGIGPIRIVAHKNASSATSASVNIASVIDLGALSWQLTSITCRIINGQSHNDSIGPLDSIRHVYTVDSVRYAPGAVGDTNYPVGTAGYILGGYGLLAGIWASDSEYLFAVAKDSLGQPLHLTTWNSPAILLGIRRERPDTLTLTSGPIAIRQAGSPVSYPISANYWVCGQPGISFALDSLFLRATGP